MQKRREILRKVCDVCGKHYETRTTSPGRERFCSKRCNQKEWNRRTYRQRKPERTPEELRRTCVVCTKEFQATKWHPRALTCSKECNIARQQERARTEKAKNRDMSERSCAECGKKYLPEKYSWTVQKYCSAACSSKVAGKRHRARYPNRKKSSHHKYSKVRIQVLERDEYTCQICDSKERLDVHHIDGTPDDGAQSHDLEKLTSLCRGCHALVHKINYRIIDGEVYVYGLLFEWMGIKSVKVLDN